MLRSTVNTSSGNLIGLQQFGYDKGGKHLFQSMEQVVHSFELPSLNMRRGRKFIQFSMEKNAQDRKTGVSSFWSLGIKQFHLSYHLFL